MNDVTTQLPKITFVTSIPDSGRGRGRQSGENIYQKLMLEMPPPAKGKGKDAALQYASFFVPAEVPATVTDPAERDKAAKDMCSKLVNRFTSVSRRIRKDHPDFDFTFRKMRDPMVEATAVGTGAWGITVYRIPPGMDKGGPVRKAAAA
jgi:hypothetical protein